MDLDIRFSEASQPLTLSSMYIGDDRYNNEATLFEIFCAIATTKCDAFNDQLTQKKEAAAAPQSTSASTRQPSIASSRERTASVQAPANGSVDPRSRRASATPLRPSGSNRPSRLRASLSMTSEAPRAATQAQADPEPLFQSGGSQSIRLTQEEVLEMAGLNFEDMDMAMDDADLDDEAGGGDDGGAGHAEDNEVPSGWDDISFDNLPAENMSTQRQQAQHAARAASQANIPEAPDHPGGVDALPERTGSAAQGQFEPDDDIFGNDSAQNIKAEPVGEEEEEEEELEPDELDPTQDSSGRKVSIETAGMRHLITDACRSSHRSSPIKRRFHISTIKATVYYHPSSTSACMFITGDMLVPNCPRVCPVPDRERLSCERSPLAGWALQGPCAFSNLGLLGRQNVASAMFACPLTDQVVTRFGCAFLSPERCHEDSPRTPEHVTIERQHSLT